MTAPKKPTGATAKRPARKLTVVKGGKRAGAPTAKRPAAKKAPAKKGPSTRARPPSPLSIAVAAFILEQTELPTWSTHHAALAELAVELARKLSGYLESPAPVARELRETLTELAPQVAADDRLDFLRDSGTPVG